MSAAIPTNGAVNRRNLELKVRVSVKQLERVHELARRFADGNAEHQHQDDRYFDVPEGRLKLRTTTDDTRGSRAELIAYRRPDRAGSRRSDYRMTVIAPDQADELASTLEHVLASLVRVRKQRTILHHGSTRIHLDEVEGLGAFVELETVVTTQDDGAAEQEHQWVIAALALDDMSIEAGSYSDLLLHRANRHQ